MTGIRLSSRTRSIRPRPAARNDDVDPVAHGQQQADGSAVAWWAAAGGPRAAGLLRPARLPAGIPGSPPEERALSDPPRRIAALPDLRQSPPGIGGHVGAALVDDPDHAQGHTDTGDLEAVGALPLRQGTLPIGSGKSAISSRPAAMASIRPGLSSKRSSKSRGQTLGPSVGHVLWRWQPAGSSGSCARRRPRSRSAWFLVSGALCDSTAAACLRSPAQSLPSELFRSSRSRTRRPRSWSFSWVLFPSQSDGSGPDRPGESSSSRPR